MFDTIDEISISYATSIQFAINASHDTFSINLNLSTNIFNVMLISS